jgi:pyruvate dehydrogenase E1 component alpha subunit
MGTSIKRSSATTDLCKRGQSFDIPGEQVDGMDVRAVKAAGDMALITPGRQGADDPGNDDLPLPRALDVRPGKIPRQGRSPEDADRARPDRAGPGAPRRKNWASENDLKEIDKDIRRVVNEAAEFAQHDPEPDPAELWTDIYAQA